jgi:hypothetical protein
MGLLDELKKRAAEKEAQRSSNVDDDARADALRAVALPALFRIHANLSELVKQLNILGDETPVTLKIPGIGDVAGFQQGNYSVSAEGTPPSTVTLRCTLKLAKVRPLEMTTAGTSPTTWVDRLRRQDLPLKVLRVTDTRGANQKALVTIEGPVPTSLQFSIDVEHAAVQLVTRNYDELVERRQFFNPADVTEPWCEELLKFVTRAPNSFLRHEVSTDVRDQLRRRLEWEKHKKDSIEETTETRLATSGRLKNLFKRPPQLKLAWRGLNWDLATHVGPFTLGRVSDCDLRMRRERVSRFHARIEFKDGEYHLVDDSSNGTYLHFLDGRRARLHKASMLLHGSGTIALGDEAAEDDPDLIHFAM